MLYFFQNNVVLQFVNGMVCWHYHLQWICGYVHVYKIIKQLCHACKGNSQTIVPLWPQATVLKSSPEPRVNSFDCSLNRHEITVYCFLVSVAVSINCIWCMVLQLYLIHTIQRNHIYATSLSAFSIFDFPSGIL
jgi:hypothetical protein